MPDSSAPDPLTPAARASVEKLAYSVNETIETLGIGRTALYALFDSGDIRTVKANGRRIVPRSAILKFLGDTSDSNVAA